MIERKKQIGRDKVSRLVNWGHWFAFFNGILAMVIGNRYIEAIGYPDTIIGWLYLSLSTIGQFSFLAFIIYLVFIFPISTIFPYSKILRGFSALIATFSLCILLYDTIVYNDYGMHLSPFAFDLAWSDLNTLLHGTSYIVTPIAILLLELVVANFIWKRIENIQKRNWGPNVVIFVCICFISSHLIHIWADARDIRAVTRFDDSYPLSYPATAKTFMETHGLKGLEKHNTSEVNTQEITNLHYPKNPLTCHKEKHANVLLITIESLRANMVTNKTMPFLSHYISQNQYFSDHYSGGNQFNSSMFSLLYGLQGSYIKAKDFNFTPPVLTQILKKEGYQLGLFIHGDQNKTVQPSAMFKDFKVHTANGHNNASSADQKLTIEFNDWSKALSSPWFALLDLRSPETYDTPVGFLGIKTIKAPNDFEPAQRVLFNQYRQSLYFIDQLLRKTIDGISKDTLVIITGLDGKVFTSNENESLTNLSPDNVKVPMVIHWPNGNASSINYPTSHYGLIPTLMTHVLGCTNPSTDYSAGRHLLEPDQQNWNYIGDDRVFAIYQPNEITVINRHGQYYIYDINYKHQLHKKMSAPELIEVMRESRRFYK